MSLVTACKDKSLWSLVGANLVTIVLALAQHWQLATILLIYWCQSVIIGIFTAARMIEVPSLYGGTLRKHGHHVKETKADKVEAVAFFFVHYGLFHAAYFYFIFSSSNLGRLDIAGAFLTGGIFLVNHAYSFAHNRQRDEKGIPIFSLFFLPYLRIIPMHLTVLSSSLAPAKLLFLFLILKTVADATMHIVQHRGVTAPEEMA